MAAAEILDELFAHALDAARPANCIRLGPPPPHGRVLVLGAGKAAASMAKAVEDQWLEALGDRLEGTVVTRYGHTVATRRIEVREAAHPVPDSAAVAAAERILELANGAGPDDFVLVLISGGASSLLTLPAEPLGLDDLQRTHDALLRSGATISEMNLIRKRLSRIKGGRLAAAIAPAACRTLLISDVPGDDPSIIGSGPTVAAPASSADALAIVDARGLSLPEPVLAVLARPGDDIEVPSNPTVQVVGAPIQSLEAAARAARQAGIDATILGDAIEGEARDVAKEHADLARRAADQERTQVLLSGGELTVTHDGTGRGGPNAEFVLALALALAGHERIHAIACDTDGIDGSETNAGARIGPDTLARARALGIDATGCLDRHDSWGFFDRLGDLVVTGPTLTNVNDFRAILIAP